MAFFGSKSKKNKILIPIAEMRRVFEYHPGGWIVTKIDRPNSPKGTRVGSLMPTGYEYLGFEGLPYYVHRVIWALCHGEQPLVVDHINGNKADNRIENLRSVTHRENIKNYYIASRQLKNQADQPTY